MHNTKKNLGVVNYEPITLYVKKGFSISQLKSYYNPENFFDTVHIFAQGDTEWDLSDEIHVHPLSHYGFKAKAQLIKYCIHYNITLLRNYEAVATHIPTLEVKYLLDIPAIISLHDVLYPPSILGYDHIFVYVEWLKEAIMEKYNHNSTLLLNRIDENLFKPDSFNNIPKEFSGYMNKIVCIGNLYERKNQENLIKAMIHVVKKYPDTILLLIGEGKDRAKYENLINNMDLSSNVKLVGSQAQEMVVEYLNWCDFHALFNDSGDLGRSLVEALMVGKPVLATGNRGNSKYHLTEGFNSKIVPYEEIYNPEYIAEALCYMIKNKHKFASSFIRERAINEYGFKKGVQLEASIYKKVLKEYKHLKISEFSSSNTKHNLLSHQKITRLILYRYALFLKTKNKHFIA